jgi:hypothetical protein
MYRHRRQLGWLSWPDWQVWKGVSKSSIVLKLVETRLKCVLLQLGLKLTNAYFLSLN